MDYVGGSSVSIFKKVGEEVERLVQDFRKQLYTSLCDINAPYSQHEATIRYPI